MFTFLLIANLALCLILTGLIWTIQLVHYPLFLNVGKANFKTYETKHQQKIAPLVAPLMLAELASSFAWLLFFCKDALAISTFQFVLVLGIWLSTFFVQMPLHGKLKDGYNYNIIKKLINTNWLRTILWTLRSIVLVYTILN